jgi:prolyl oligopeptidase
MDPFEYLEDLEDDRTKRFIESSNAQVEKRLGQKAKEVFPSLVEKLREERPIQLLVLGNTQVILYYGDETSLEISGRRIKMESRDHVIHSLERVWNSQLVRIGVGIRGSDEGYSLLIDPNGEVVGKIEGLVNQFFYQEGKLCYVKEYRREKSPDGVEPPVERIFCGDEMFPFYPGRGEWLSVTAEEKTTALLKGRGWSEATLYVGEWPELREEDSGKISSVHIVRGRVYYLKGNDVMMDGKKLFSSNHPVEDMKVNEKFVVLNVIKDYRSSLSAFTPSGEPLWEYRGEHVYSFDLMGEDVYALETSFTTSHSLLRIRDGKPYPLRVGRREEMEVKDVYVKGDVLLHGFLLTRGKPKGVIVYGYGGFSVPVLPFSSAIFQELVKRGYSVLVTNLRGGSENGEEWHRQGMLRNKLNVFRDFSTFLSLVKSLGGRTVAMGGSNGGLLVGATMNMYPDLVDCGIIGYPVLDMLKFHKFLAGMYWTFEYGNPEGDDRDFLLSYSPYHNLKEGLPPTFVYTGLNDDRVHPMHALKYTAKSRSLGNDVMLLVNLRSGHNASTPESRAEEMAYVMAFIEECVAHSSSSLHTFTIKK